MGLARWLSKNWANTHEPTHADLKTLVLAMPIEAAIELVKKTVAGMPRWNVETSPVATQLHLTRRTRTIRFVDDVVLTFQPDSTGTKIDAASRSRIGKGDLGQNRRNILELWKAINEHPGDR